MKRKSLPKEHEKDVLIIQLPDHRAAVTVVFQEKQLFWDTLAWGIVRGTLAESDEQTLALAQKVQREHSCEKIRTARWLFQKRYAEQIQIWIVREEKESKKDRFHVFFARPDEELTDEDITMRSRYGMHYHSFSNARSAAAIMAGKLNNALGTGAARIVFTSEAEADSSDSPLERLLQSPPGWQPEELSCAFVDVSGLQQALEEKAARTETEGNSFAWGAALGYRFLASAALPWVRREIRYTDLVLERMVEDADFYGEDILFYQGYRAALQEGRTLQGQWAVQMPLYLTLQVFDPDGICPDASKEWERFTIQPQAGKVNLEGWPGWSVFCELHRYGDADAFLDGLTGGPRELPIVMEQKGQTTSFWAMQKQAWEMGRRQLFPMHGTSEMKPLVRQQFSLPGGDTGSAKTLFLEDFFDGEEEYSF